MFLTRLWDPQQGEPVWELYAIAEGGECQVTASLDQWLNTPELEAYAAGLVALLEQISRHERGPALFHGNQTLCHEAVTGEAIYRFRKGDLRLYWFYGDDRKVVIFPYCEIKRTEKVAASVKRRLIAARDEYREAHRKAKLKIV